LRLLPIPSPNSLSSKTTGSHRKGILYRVSRDYIHQKAEHNFMMLNCSDFASVVIRIGTFVIRINQ